MRSILAEPVWGLLPLTNGVAYIKYKPYHEGRVLASFWQFSAVTGNAKQIPQELYFRLKFGEYFGSIVKQIDPSLRLSCQTAVDTGGKLMVLSPQTGDFNLFDGSGRLHRQGALMYNGSAISSPVFAGGDWWGICPDKNAVLRIQSGDWTWDFSVGGEGKPDFPEPVHLSAYIDREGSTRLYVCCKGSESIRSLNPDKQRLFIRDFCSLPGYQPLRYFRAAKQHLVLLADGVWAL
ncbi:MAG: hypothetical protein LBJ12_09325 [Oscillospiraceae bacterium]|jgi:hypothetical protein|nr:hypothetical protein [Oscillospiraceae bacterium]